MPERPFTIADQATLEPGYYWIRRCEPDGPPYWEVALFQRSANDAWWWTVDGSPYPKQPTHNPNASNAWKIGERVER